MLSNSTKFAKLRYDDIVTLTTKLEDKTVRLVNKLGFLGIIPHEQENDQKQKQVRFP